MVEEDVYRSSQPNELSFPFLERLQLRTIIYLAPEEPHQKFLNFIDDQEIHFEHLTTMGASGLAGGSGAAGGMGNASGLGGMGGTGTSLGYGKHTGSGINNTGTALNIGTGGTGNAWDPISEEIVLEALELILNPRNHPLMIMCNLGRHRTGTIVGCLRKLQKWSLTAIFEEYRRYAGAKVRVLNEQFIELFDTDLVRIPTHKPHWLQ